MAWDEARAGHGAALAEIGANFQGENDLQMNKETGIVGLGGAVADALPRGEASGRPVARFSVLGRGGFYPVNNSR